jgi:hypothetical protein
MKFSGCGSRGRECKARLSKGRVSNVYVLPEEVVSVLLLPVLVVVAAAQEVLLLMVGVEGREGRKALARRLWLVVVGRD